MAGPLAPVSDFVVGVVKVDGEFGGFTEKYPFAPGIDMTAGRERLGWIIKARSRLLAGSHEILNAHCSQQSIIRDRRNPTGLVAADYLPRIITGDAGAPEETDYTGVGLLLRFDTLAGKFSNRLLKAVRDSWIVKNRLTLGAPTVYAPSTSLTYAVPPATDTGEDLLGNYMALVRDYCCLYVPILNLPSPEWTPYTFEEAAYRRVSKHDLGRRVVVTRGRKKVMS